MDSIDWIIINKSLDGSLNDQESEILSEWLAESAEHRALYQKIKAYDSYSLSDEKFEQWRSEYTNVLSRLKQHRNRRFIRRKILVSTSVAAVFAFVALFTLFLNHPEPGSVNLNESGEHSKVQLQLANGNWLDLDTIKENRLTGMDHVNVSSSDKTLTYQRADSLRQMEYNILKTERGGEWNVTLEDGTRVYLNSSSTLKYPVSFAGESRQVFLEGEAYFEVTHNPNKPFIVKTNDMNILVRGTSFNINAYPDYKIVRTTLVNGKIDVECSGNTHTILPGQQIVFEKETRSVKIQEVDTELYTSWKNGFYKFNETRLEDILAMLSLWYDVDVIYADESVKDLCFTSSGKMARYDNLINLLKKFEYTNNVTFELNGKKLTVRKK